MSSGYVHTADPMAPLLATTTATAPSSVPSVSEQAAGLLAGPSMLSQTNGQYMDAMSSDNPDGAMSMPPYSSVGPMPPQYNDVASFAQYPISTQEILKRASENNAFSAGSPAWEAAREQVLKNMAVSNHSMPPPQPLATSGRGRGRGRGAGSAAQSSGITHAQLAMTVDGVAAAIAKEEDSIPISATPVKRGRGRPRGSGKKRAAKSVRRSTGRKRKRGDDEEEEEEDSPSADDNESEVSASYTPLATITKSGRSVTKPTQFNPVAEASPDGEGKRRRGYRRGPEFQLCAKCQRGHSPPSNVIVFCDGCNSAYHQWCHDPHIPRDVVDVAEKEWFCSKCLHKREMEKLPLDKRISGQGLSADEKRDYLSTLPTPTLVSLLLHATKLHPSLPIFTPNVDALPLDHGPTNGTATEEDEDPYPDYSNSAPDPPSTYPRPGHGPIKLRPLTDPDDMPWLIDDNPEVFSHLVDDGTGTLVPIQTTRNGAWLDNVDANDVHHHEDSASLKAAGVSATTEGIEEDDDEQDAEGDADEEGDEFVDAVANGSDIAHMDMVGDGNGNSDAPSFDVLSVDPMQLT